MSDAPTGTEIKPAESSGDEYCYGHPRTPTRLHCSRCNKPICGRCAVPAAVGQHCVWCVAEARKSAPKVRRAIRANAPVVYAIIVINVIIWIGQNLTIHSTGAANITDTFASFPPLIAAGEWWRLITPMFLHATLFEQFGIFHILLNMYILGIYGPNVEQAFGGVRFLAMYLIAGFMGSAASYAFGPCNAAGLGASGAIFGIVGVLLVYLYRRRSSTFVVAYMKNLLLFIGLNLVFGLAVAGIDNFAHMGGLAGGVLLGAGFDAGPRGQQTTKVQVATAIGVTALGVALVVWRTASFTCGPVG
jgi:membrane associated rhomboid family serine protease